LALLHAEFSEHQIWAGAFIASPSNKAKTEVHNAQSDSRTVNGLDLQRLHSSKEHLSSFPGVDHSFDRTNPTRFFSLSDLKDSSAIQAGDEAAFQTAAMG
jgi:hypothetical protein